MSNKLPNSKLFVSAIILASALAFTGCSRTEFTSSQVEQGVKRELARAGSLTPSTLASMDVKCPAANLGDTVTCDISIGVSRLPRHEFKLFRVDHHGDLLIWMDGVTPSP